MAGFLNYQQMGTLKKRDTRVFFGWGNGSNSS